MSLTRTQREALEEACALVEQHLRTLGPCAQVTVLPDSVEVADASWTGSCVEPTLYKALIDAMESHWN